MGCDVRPELLAHREQLGTAMGPQWHSVRIYLFSCLLAESEELHIERFTLAVALNTDEGEEVQ